MVKIEKHDILASKQNIKNTIKGGKEFADKIMDGAQINTLLKEYHIKYGENQFVQKLISAYANIKGGIAFNNSKEQMLHLIKNNENR